MKTIRTHLTYANLAATLALFLALTGGIAFAAGQLTKNSVGTNQLKNGAVSTAKIKAGAVTGSKVDLATLGKVPSATAADTAAHAATATRADSATTATSAANAQALGGNPAGAFVRGGGQLLSAHQEITFGSTDVPFFTIPGLATVTATCKAGTTKPQIDFVLHNTTTSVIDQTLQYSQGIDAGRMKPGETLGFGEESTTAATIQLATQTTPSTVASFDFSMVLATNSATSNCIVFAQGTVAGT
jgi:hypothetical protein